MDRYEKKVGLGKSYAPKTCEKGRKLAYLSFFFCFSMEYVFLLQFHNAGKLMGGFPVISPEIHQNVPKVLHDGRY